MVFLQPELAGEHVRLEPLAPRHAAGLVAATADAGDLYRMTTVPFTEGEAVEYVALAEAMRAAGDGGAVRRDPQVGRYGNRLLPAVGPAVVALARRASPPRPRRPGHLRDRPHLAGPSAIRTGVNTEMKRLMLTHAFETWEVQSMSFHTDARNARSANAIERIGGRFEGILRSHRLASDLPAQGLSPVLDHGRRLARR